MANHARLFKERYATLQNKLDEDIRKKKFKAVTKEIQMFNKNAKLYHRRNKAKVMNEIKRKVKRIEAKLTLKDQEEIVEARDLRDFVDTYSIGIANKLREKRTVNEALQIIEQKPIAIYNTLKEYRDNRAMQVFNKHYKRILNIARYELFSSGKVTRAFVTLIYIIGEKDDKTKKDYKIFYTTGKNAGIQEINAKTDMTKLYWKTVDNYEGNYVIGYRIGYVTNAPLAEQDVYKLRAFSEITDRNYHNMTCTSTSTNKLCIYETFMDIIGKISLKHSRRNDNKNRERIQKMLKDEGQAIETAVKKGEVYLALELLTMKYNTSVLLVYFGSEFYIDDRTNELKMQQTENFPVLFTRGIHGIVKNMNSIKGWLGKKSLLYYKNVHVAPFLFNALDYGVVVELLNKKAQGFVLAPENVKKIRDKVKGVLGFDYETHPNEKNEAIPFCVTIHGYIGEDKIANTYYGPDCVVKFADYLEEICTKKNVRKSRANKAIQTIYLYGFNNRNFDNLFIWQEIYKRNPCFDFCLAGNSIKYMKYHNITILDISSYYQGSLASVAEKGFRLDIVKGVYPYSFPNKDNLDYKGVVPNKKYFNSEKDYNKCVEETKNVFDLKEYTTKYCMMDSRLVFEIAQKHLKSCTGMINGRLFDVRDCVTAASLAVKLFKQCFLNRKIYGHTGEVLDAAKRAYKGGRTEVFKKYFEKLTAEDILVYLDINSSYPASMLEPQPIAHVGGITEMKEAEFKFEELNDVFLYYAKSTYVGTDENVIPNLLIRDEKTKSIIACKNTDYDWHWGKELKEAILNKFQIKVKKMMKFASEPIFKEFAEYFYNERLKVKATNPALAMFYKTVMNSLYGKFAQRSFNSYLISDNMNDVYRRLSKDIYIIDDLTVYKNLIICGYKKIDDEYDGIGKLLRLSSYIAASSRCKLSEMMREVGHHNIYYGDTDSVFSSKMPSDKYLDQNKLGAWKREVEGNITRAYFIAPKAYAFEIDGEEKVQKAKGIKGKDLKFSEYKDLVTGKIDNVKQTNKLFIRGFDAVQIIDQERTMSCVYNKRIWEDNNSKPFDSIEEWKNGNFY